MYRLTFSTPHILDSSQDPRYLATFMMESERVLLLDIRQPSVPVAELSRHHKSVNALAWAPHSPDHMCTAGDDCQALIWDLSGAVAGDMVRCWYLDPTKCCTRVHRTWIPSLRMMRGSPSTSCRGRQRSPTGWLCVWALVCKYCACEQHSFVGCCLASRLLVISASERILRNDAPPSAGTHDSTRVSSHQHTLA